MQTYEIRAESPETQQFRTYSIAAENEDHARDQVQAKEEALAAFDLHPPVKDVWEDPLGAHRDDAHVDLSLWDQHDPVLRGETAKHESHAEAKRFAVARIDDWRARVQFDKAGKIVATTLGSRSKARIAAHLQAEPFAIVNSRHVPQAEIDAGRLVNDARYLSENDPEKWDAILREIKGPTNTVTSSLFGVPTRNRADGTTNGAIAWKASGGDTHKVMAASNTYTPNLDTHDFKDDITNEVTGTNWSAGGVALTSLSPSYDSTTDQARYDAADISVATVTISGVRYFVDYKSTGTDSTSALVFIVNCGADVAATAGTLAVTWDATGAWLDDVT